MSAQQNQDIVILDIEDGGKEVEIESTTNYIKNFLFKQ